jgi:hypothetical protein
MSGVNMSSFAALRGLFFDPPELTYTEKVVDTLSKGGAQVVAFAAATSEKIQTVWEFVKPLFEILAKICASPIGASILLMGGTILLLKVSQYSKNPAVCIAFMVAGISCAVLTGAYFLHVGLIPLTATSFSFM